MRKLFLFTLASAFIACGSKKTVVEGKPDSTKTDIKNQVENSLSPTAEITVDNAKSVTSFENTPESIVMYFYASKIRKDSEWEKVCLPAEKRTDKFKRGLEEYNKWGFTKYRYVDKKEFDKGKYWVKIYMSITFEGTSDDGEDEVTVEMIDGKWMITEVPT